METRITKLLGSKYPMIQGGMAWIAESTLASAVSNAGAVGLIAGGSAPIDYLREQIRICKEKNMFVVNEKDFEYRFGDSGPKYLMKGPRMNYALVQFQPGQDFQAHYHNVMEENFYMRI